MRTFLMADSELVGQAEADDLTFDIPDDVLERAASAEQKAFTMLYCITPGTTVACHSGGLAQ
jgi:hypothetical protein